MLVNSDTAVSVVHSVFLVGSCCCHMKRMCISSFLLAGSKRQRYFKGEIYPQPEPPRRNYRKAEHAQRFPPHMVKTSYRCGLWHSWAWFPRMQRRLIKLCKWLGTFCGTLVGFDEVKISKLPVLTWETANLAVKESFSTDDSDTGMQCCSNNLFFVKL